MTIAGEAGTTAGGRIRAFASDPNNRFTIAVMLMLVSGFGFALMNLFVRLSGDLPAMQKSFFRNFVVFFVALFVLYRQRDRKRVTDYARKDYVWLMLRSVFGTVGIIANFYSVDHMPLANASVLNKLSPFFTIIFSAMFLREKVNRVQFFGIATAFAGVVILSKPDAGGLDPAHLFPILVAILGGITAGAAYTCVRYLGTNGVSGSFIVCFFSGFSCLIMLPSLLLHYRPMTAEQVLYMFLIGVSAMVGQYGVTYAYRFARPNRISIFDYSMVIFATILGMVFLGQVPDVYVILGSIVIFLAFLMMFLYNLRLGEK